MKILIIDDHALFRAGLRLILNELQDDIQILEAPDAEQARGHFARAIDIDLVLLDLNIPGEDSFTLLTQFAKTHPTIPIVIVSASTNRSDMQRTLDAGAMGYIPKDTASDVMLNALRQIFSGAIYVPQNMTQHIDVHRSSGNTPTLTPRQLQVLTCLAQGDSNGVIASRLNLSEATVKWHITAIMKSLGVSNRTQAAMAAEKLGLRTNIEN